MNRWILIFLFLIFTNAVAEEKAKKSEDKNFLMAIQEFKKSITTFNKNTDKKNEIELALKTFKDSLCLASLGDSGSRVTFADVNIEPEQIKMFEERIKELSKNEDFSKKMMVTGLVLMNGPESACSFKLDKSTPKLLSKKKAEDEEEKKLSDILKLKKSIHPVFVKLISDIEKQKDILSGRVFAPVRLTTDNEKSNFAKIYEYETGYVAAKCLNQMALFPSDCIESIKKTFNEKCMGKPSYMLVKEQVTRYLLCADDNQDLLNKKCEYKPFFDISNSSEGQDEENDSEEFSRI